MFEVKIRGFSDHQIQIESPQVRLNSLGITVADVATALADQSIDLPDGTIKTNERDVIVRFAGQRRRLREFDDVVITSGSTGAEVRLGDVAKIKEGFERPEDRIDFNGKRAGMLEVRKSRSQDALRVLEHVRQFILDEERRQPASERIPGRFVDLVMRWPGTSVFTLLAIFAITLWVVASRRLPFKTFPDIDGDIATAGMGMPLSRLEEVVDQVTAAATLAGNDLQDRQPRNRKPIQSIAVQYGTNTDARETRDAPIDEVLVGGEMLREAPQTRHQLDVY